ncbi:MAG: type II toxin-antitoxin system RelE/ParE family toxin [Motiliproteus sp.]
MEDLGEVADYIALSNNSAAKNLVQTVFEKIQRLTELPESGREPPELKGLNYREIIVNPCRVLYKIDGDEVFILHILRQERELRKYMLKFCHDD